jgi:ribosomal protein S18 acetylase RimI-like enzyme
MISIQQATKEDVIGIQEVFYKAWLEAYPNEEVGITREDVEEKYKNRLSPEMIQKRTAGVLDPSENNLFLVAKDADDVVGVCWLEKLETQNKLGAIYILPEYQKQGIGKMFWEKIKDYFGDDKDIIVEVATYNANAIAFYQKLGFADTGKRFSEERLRMLISGVLIPEMEMIIKAKK